MSQSFHLFTKTVTGLHFHFVSLCLLCLCVSPGSSDLPCWHSGDGLARSRCWSWCWSATEYSLSGLAAVVAAAVVGLAVVVAAAAAVVAVVAGGSELGVGDWPFALTVCSHCPTSCLDWDCCQENWSVRKPENITSISPLPQCPWLSYLWYLDLLLDVNGVGGPGGGGGGAGAGAIEAGAGARPAQLKTSGTSRSRGRELPLTQHL